MSITCFGKPNLLSPRPACHSLLFLLETHSSHFPRLNFEIKMAGVGVSLVDDRPLELLYLLAGGISADITATARHRMLSVTVDWLQVCSDSRG